MDPLGDGVAVLPPRTIEDLQNQKIERALKPVIVVFRHASPQSTRSASSGLSRAARRAGSQHARAETARSSSVVAPKTQGSRGVMPYNSDAIKRLPASATMTPMVAPARATALPCLRIIAATLRGSAPSAIRTPISDVRWLTIYDMTP